MTAIADLLTAPEFVIGLAAGAVSALTLGYKLWTRQQRHHRALFGSDEDHTRDGLAVEQEHGFRQLNERLDEIEASVERGFADAERERREARDDIDDVCDDVDHLCQNMTHVAHALGDSQHVRETDILPPRGTDDYRDRGENDSDA